MQIFLSLTVFCNYNVCTTLFFSPCCLMILIINVMFSHSNETEWKLCSEMTQHITYSLICGQVYLRICSAQVMPKDFDKRELKSLMFFSLWVELQFKLVQKTTLILEFLRVAYIKRDMWHMYILLKIFRAPIITWSLNKNIGIRAFSKQYTLWHHFCMTNFDSSELSETKHGWSWKKPRGFWIKWN